MHQWVHLPENLGRKCARKQEQSDLKTKTNPLRLMQWNISIAAVRNFMHLVND